MTAPVGAGTAVRWLTAQAVAFGVMAALLGVVANAIFLDTYGAEWLPATYIAIGFVGVVLSGAVARSARSGAIVRAERACAQVHRRAPRPRHGVTAPADRARGALPRAAAAPPP